MSIIPSIKYHIIALRRLILIYVVAFVLIIFAANSLQSYLEDFYTYFISGMFILTFLFTILLGFYTYTILVKHYFKLRSSRRGFYVSSLIFSIMNAIFQTILIFIAYLVLNNIFSADITELYNFNSFKFYLFFFNIHLTIFALISVFAFYLNNLKLINFILYSLLLIAIGFLSVDKANSVIVFMTRFFKSISPLGIILLEIITLVLSWSFILLKIRTFNKKTLSN